jgi:acetyl esterase
MSTPQSAAGADSSAPVLEPTTQKFIDALAAAGGPPIYTLSPDAARDVLAGAQAQPSPSSRPRSRTRPFPPAPPDRCESASSGRRAGAACCRS